MDTTQVIIQFVGLCLFSSAVPNDPGVHAILPRIATSHRHERRNVPQMTQNRIESVPVTAPGPEGIEEHVAMLVFPADIIEDDSEWKARPVPHTYGSLTGYKQITFRGERVTFLVDGPNLPPAVPANIPRFSCDQNAAVSAASLTAGFQWPYADAAAVIDIPEGKLTACNAARNDRVDTKLKLETSGRLTIVGMKQGVAKSLVLNTAGNPRIYLLNVPYGWARKVAAAGTVGSESHYVAYHQMIGAKPGNTCGGAPRVVAGQTVTEPCGGDAERLTDAVGSEEKLRFKVMIEQMANSECSNSAWP